MVERARRAEPVWSTCRRRAARRPASATTRTSSGDAFRLPACGTSMNRMPVPLRRSATARSDWSASVGSELQPVVVEHLRREARRCPGACRQVCARKRPRSGGIVWRAAEQVLQRRCSAPGGWLPLTGWSSCCGSPSSTRFRAAPATRARWRATSGPPRRRTACRPCRRSPRAPTSRRCRPATSIAAGGEGAEHVLVVADALAPMSALQRSSSSAFCMAAHDDPRRPRPSHDLVEQVAR